MGRFLLFWGMQPAARIICRLRAANAVGCAGLFAAVRRMRHDKSLWKAPRAWGGAAFLIF